MSRWSARGSRGAIARVAELAPEAEIRVLSSTELAFRLCGLEFARAQLAQAPGFRNVEEVVFGAGPYQAALTEENAAEFAGFVRAVRAARCPDGQRANPLWRMQPERWLESLVARDVSALDSRLDPACVYSQVPAFSASDRAMIDVLALTRERRLAVVELKADEDIHLPLQGLDYWARVEWHRARGEFQKFGYFPGIEIAPAPATAAAGRTLSARPPHHRCAAALHRAGNRLRAGGDQREMAGGHSGGVPEKTHGKGSHGFTRINTDRKAKSQKPKARSCFPAFSPASTRERPSSADQLQPSRRGRRARCRGPAGAAAARRARRQRKFLRP